jgi:hypothetical protein
LIVIKEPLLIHRIVRPLLNAKKVEAIETPIATPNFIFSFYLADAYKTVVIAIAIKILQDSRHVSVISFIIF